MRAFSIVTITAGGTLLLVSAILLVTGTELEFLDFEEEKAPVEFFHSGQLGNLTVSDTTNPDFLGLEVYVFGNYVDANDDALWDICDGLEIYFWLNGTEQPESTSHENNSFYPSCEIGSERTDLIEDSLIYVGQLCVSPTNNSIPNCSEGVYRFESTIFSKMVLEYKTPDESLFSSAIDSIISGLKTGTTSLCGGIFFLVMGYAASLIPSEQETEKSSSPSSLTVDGPKAEWRAYALSQTERGSDGLPKAYGRHRTTRDLFAKPRKGNRRGGVHKGGGLHLSGWTEDDSDQEYKRKVKDRRGKGD